MMMAAAAAKIPTAIQQQDDEYDRVHAMYCSAQRRIAAAGCDDAELAAAETAFHPIQQAFLTNRERAMPTECYQIIASYLDRVSRVRLAACDHHLHDYVIYGGNSGAAVWREGDELEKVYRRETLLMSPLWHASREGALRAVRALILARADVHACDDYSMHTALYHGCLKGHEQVVQVLLEAGADVNVLGRTGVSPLYFSCIRGDLLSVRRLLASGAHVNAGCDGFRPLNGASHSNRAEVVTVLLEARADVAYTNWVGRSALHYAAEDNGEDVVPVLVAAGADINHRDTNGATPLMHACVRGRVASVVALLAAGADPNITDQENRSPLMRASRCGDDERVTILLAAGADVHLVDTHGRTAVMRAKRDAYDSTVALLLAAGAADDAMDVIDDDGDDEGEYRDESVYYTRQRRRRQRQ